MSVDVNTPKVLQNSTKCDSFADFLDYQIVDCLTTEPQLTDQELAKMLGVSRATINKRRNHGGARRLIQSTFHLKQDTLRRLAVLSLKKLEDHINNPDPRISIAATGLFLRSLEPLRNIADSTVGATDIVYQALWGSSQGI